VLRVEVSEQGRDALPPVDVDGDFVIGSGPDARIRLPAGAGRVDVRAADVGDGKTFELGSYRVRVAPAPAGAVAATPQRTESLARELVRSMLGANAAPTLEIERGRLKGAKRALAPPESVLVIGRGDEAGWIVDDKDLSRAHAEVRRAWDGVKVFDLGAKNGTRVDGERVGEGGAELYDGAVIELGKVVFRYRDPAERHLGGGEDKRQKQTGTGTGTGTMFYVALAIVVLAVAGFVWIVAS
jgi:hypothetical protein